MGSSGSQTQTQGLGYNDLPQNLKNVSLNNANWANSIQGNAGIVSGNQGNIASLSNSSNFSGVTDYLNNVLSGKYTNLDTNPQWQSSVQNITNQYGKAVNGLNMTANKSGMMYSGAAANNQAALGSSLASALSGTAGQIYGQERGYQDKAVSGLSDLYKTQTGLNEASMNAQGYGSTAGNQAVSTALGGPSIGSISGGSK